MSYFHCLIAKKITDNPLLLLICCLHLASSFIDRFCVLASDLSVICGKRFTTEEIWETSYRIHAIFDYNVYIVSPVMIVNLIVSNYYPQHKDRRKETCDLIASAMVSPRYYRYSQNSLSIAALCIITGDHGIRKRFGETCSSSEITQAIKFLSCQAKISF